MAATITSNKRPREEYKDEYYTDVPNDEEYFNEPVDWREHKNPAYEPTRRRTGTSMISFNNPEDNDFTTNPLDNVNNMIQIVFNDEKLDDNVMVQVTVVGALANDDEKIFSTHLLPITDLYASGEIENLFIDAENLYNVVVVERVEIYYYQPTIGCEEYTDYKNKKKLVVSKARDNYCVDRAIAQGIVIDLTRDEKLLVKGDEINGIKNLVEKQRKRLVKLGGGNEKHRLENVKEWRATRKKLKLPKSDALTRPQMRRLIEYNDCRAQIMEEREGKYQIIGTWGKEDALYEIAILLRENHAQCIRDIKMMHPPGQKYCEACNEYYSTLSLKHQYKCKATCEMCDRRGCPGNKGEEMEYCEDCNTEFKDSTDDDDGIKSCFEFHKELKGKYSKCNTRETCKDCGIYEKKSRHQCKFKYCKVCKRKYELDHFDKITCTECLDFKNEECSKHMKKVRVKGNSKCFVKKTGYEKPLANIAFIDIETDQTNKGIHKIALICLSEVDIEDGTEEDPEHFWSEYEFWEYILGNMAGKIILAHGGGRFDLILLKNSFEEYSKTSGKDREINPMYRPASKTMLSLTIGSRRSKKSIIFKDSLNWLTMKLKDFAKELGLDKSKYSKGDFPILGIGVAEVMEMKTWPTNVVDNEKGESPMSRFLKYYAEGQRTPELVNFLKEQMGKPFDAKKELLKYCQQDVEVLKEGALKFRRMFMQITKRNESDQGCDPFTGRKTTIARTCLQVYKSMFMPENAIPIYTQTENQVFRDYFYGGRTQKMRAYWKSSGSHEKGKCYDVNSEYPYVMSEKPYPLGRPKKYIKGVHYKEDKEAFDMIAMEGTLAVMRCDVIPPKDKLIYLIPHRDLNKLLQFNAEDKIGIGVTGPEYLEALKHGYTFKNVKVFYHWERTTTTLFKPYMDSFYKMKIQHSSPPSELMIINEEKNPLEYKMKKEVIEKEWSDHYGFKVDFSKKEDISDALRLISKICLNSLWGKFAQREDTYKREIFRDTDEDYVKMQKILQDRKLFKKVQLISTDPYQLSIAYKTQISDVPSDVTNIPIAIFTTAYGRLKLWEGLNELNPEQVLYCDTDSIIYIKDETNSTHVDLKSGEIRGQYKNELIDNFGEGWIIEAIFLAGKSYSLLLNRLIGKKGICITKSKGFTIANLKVRESINHASMRTLLKCQLDGVQDTTIEVEDIKISRVTKKNETGYVNTTLQTLKYKKRIKYIENKGRLHKTSLIIVPYGSIYKPKTMVDPFGVRRAIKKFKTDFCT